MDTILFILHAASVGAVCYMFLVDDKRGRGQVLTSLFRYKTDLSTPRQQMNGRNGRGGPARPGPQAPR